MNITKAIITKLKTALTLKIRKKPELRQDADVSKIKDPNASSTDSFIAHSCAPEMTMKEFLERGGIPCKIGQSKRGVSIENVFAKYTKGEITQAEDQSELLSFVNCTDIIKCIDYGDTLVLFETNENILYEHGLLNEVVHCKGQTLGEMTTKCLLTVDTYSLKDPLTLMRMFEMSDNDSVFLFLGLNARGRIEKSLQLKGCEETADYLRFVFNKYRNELATSPFMAADQIKDNVINDYIEWYNELDTVKNYQPDVIEEDQNASDSEEMFVGENDTAPFAPTNTLSVRRKEDMEKNRDEEPEI